ncbi:hypothetical protein NDU88_009430, partial [Pleurodeles waltl]
MLLIVRYHFMAFTRYHSNRQAAQFISLCLIHVIHCALTFHGIYMVAFESARRAIHF